MAAGGMGQFVASPTDLIKTQIQMEGKRRLQGLPPRVHGTLDAFKKILAQNGISIFAAFVSSFGVIRKKMNG